MLPSPPIEPAPTGWNLARSLSLRSTTGDLIAVGADLEPGTILAAYRSGIFPMGLDEAPGMGWWSPVRRGILPPGALRVSRSLRKSARRYRITVDRDFRAVLDGCARSGRGGDWISAEIAAAYVRLHTLGWVHSVEVWDAAGELVGGLYGVSIGALFAGESMFHRATDASKVALVGLLDVLGPSGDHLLDVQWQTRHLASLGVVEISRSDYLARLPAALAGRRPDWAGAGRRDWVAGSPE
ncbi:MAG: leucyl/phenylalanyl-tRNA--protein transferase [Dermatophilaceae bacterium]